MEMYKKVQNQFVYAERNMVGAKDELHEEQRRAVDEISASLLLYHVRNNYGPISRKEIIKITKPHVQKLVDLEKRIFSTQMSQNIGTIEETLDDVLNTQREQIGEQTKKIELSDKEVEELKKKKIKGKTAEKRITDNAVMIIAGLVRNLEFTKDEETNDLTNNIGSVVMLEMLKGANRSDRLLMNEVHVKIKDVIDAVSVKENIDHVFYQAILDRRTREEHRALDGKIVPLEIALINLSEPNCRCVIFPLLPRFDSSKEVEAYNEAVANGSETEVVVDHTAFREYFIN